MVVSSPHDHSHYSKLCEYHVYQIVGEWCLKMSPWTNFCRFLEFQNRSASHLGEGAALILVIFGLYALSGAGSIRRLPLLRLGLVGISSLYLLRGLFFILTLLLILGVFQGEILIQGVISNLVFLTAGITYAVGTALNWREMKIHR
jgi:hypothetical protein